MSRTEYWNELAKTKDLDTLAKAIDSTWVPKVKKYAWKIPINPAALEMIGGRRKCLDFGCGLGRNFEYLQEIFEDVKGYDLTEVISKASTVVQGDLTSDWSNASSKIYDLIYACNTIEAMDIDDFNEKIKDIGTISRYFYVVTRAYTDQGRNFEKKSGGMNVAVLINSTNLFEPVWSTIDMNMAMCLNDDTEYHVLYKTK